MTFRTAVWIDPETEHYRARIFPEVDGINLAAWGLTAADVEPIDLERSALTGPHGLGFAIEEALEAISPDFPITRFAPIFLGAVARGADIRAELTAKLAAIAA